MAEITELRTERLLLRRWRVEDRAGFAALNDDPQVMAHMPGRLTRRQSDQFADRIEELFDEHGWGLWAVEVLRGEPFVGYVGLTPVPFDPPFATVHRPPVEVGWRLARPAWGHGYASEGAAAAVSFGFDVLDLDEIVSFTTPANARSRAVMARLGMTHDPIDDFDHPRLPAGHRLRRHVLYRLAAPS